MTNRSVTDFKEQGFAVLESALSPETIKEVSSQIEALHDMAIVKAGSNPADFDGLDAKYNFLRDTHPSSKSKCYDLAKNLDAVIQALTSKKLIEFGHSLFNGPLVTQNFQIRILDNTNERIYPLHQEIGLITETNFTAWIALTDVAIGNGGLTCVPGSHCRGELPHYYTEGASKYRVIQDGYIDPDEVIEVCVKAGDAVVFDPLLAHGSATNKSGRNRWSLIGRYNSLADLPLAQS